ncbi:MAG: hypothetical protein KBS77_05200 [Bacteroidales bacterium]|nr:hypothetical protein [Candidatus Colicola faecequi]
MKKLFYISLIACTLASCSVFSRHDANDDIAVELHGKTLSRQVLEQVTERAETEEDSASLADAYIRQWAGDILFYDKAMNFRDEQIEQLVEAYRRELYMKRYEERLVKKMDHTLTDDTISAFYEAHPELFTLDENLVKGLMLIVPNGAADLNKLRQWVQHPERDIEKIEKYAYRYATGYELFTESWKTGNQIILKMPISQDELTAALRQRKQIEVRDSTLTYLLEVTDHKLVGDKMPLDVATPEIRKIMLAERQVDFIQQQKDAMFEEADLLFRIKRR